MGIHVTHDDLRRNAFVLLRISPSHAFEREVINIRGASENQSSILCYYDAFILPPSQSYHLEDGPRPLQGS
jgi:hypothetical protein